MERETALVVKSINLWNIKYLVCTVYTHTRTDCMSQERPKIVVTI